MDPFEGTLFRVNAKHANERISEFSHFYLVIRLRRVNSWPCCYQPFLFADPAACVAPREIPALLQESCTEQPQAIFSIAACTTTEHYMSGWGSMLLGVVSVVFFLLMVLWWAWQVVRPIREEVQIAVPTSRSTDHCPFEGITHDLALRNWIPSSTNSPCGPLFHAFSLPYR